MPLDVEYTRKYALCKNVASTGSCARAPCSYSHTLVDTARILALVGAVPPPPPSTRGTTSSASATENENESGNESGKTHFLIECTKYAQPQTDAAEPGRAAWRMRLLAGGRATLAVGAAGETISVQPAYPVKGQGAAAAGALVALEARVFGRSPQPDQAPTTLCKSATEDTCRRPACKYSHTLFDTRRVEALLDEAVRERGYADFRPLVEAEYVRAPAGAFSWRVTLRCVVAYERSAPQPVVVTSADLGGAMRLLEAQFAGSAGRAPRPPPTPAPASTPQSPRPQNERRRPSVSSPRNSGHGRRSSGRGGQAHNRQQSSGRAQPRATPDSVPLAAHPSGPPPSYTDAMGGVPPASTAGAKVRR